MKRQPLSMLALASLLILSSCGQTAGVKTAGAQQTTGEIVASSETAIAQTESGKVGGFLQDGIYIYKGIPYAKAERFMPPQPADKWEGVRSSRMFGPTCPRRCVWAGVPTSTLSPSTGTTAIPAKTACGSTSGLRA